jgi:hypothetical protein
MPRAAPSGVSATVPEEQTAPATAGERTWLARAVIGSPESIAAAVAGFSVGPMMLLLLGHFTAPLTVPLGCIGAVVAVWCCGTAPAPVSRADVSYTLAAIATAVGWVAYNLRYTAQDLYATRDPATYTITGRWLVDHSSLQIHTHPEIFGSPPGATVASGSYAHISGDVLNSQGNHLLPAFLGISGSLFGTGAVFATNVVLTALALLVFFGLARRIVDIRLALVLMVALAVSMPIVYVGRDTYTEPLTLLFLIGALALVHRGFTSGRVADFALAGLVGGAATMVRIDSYGALIGLVVGAIVVAGIGIGGRRAGLLRALALLAGMGVTTLIGWLDLARLSKQYYGSQHHNIVLLLFALLAVVAAAPAVIWLVGDERVRTWLTADRVRMRVVVAANALLLVAFAVLVSRPAWMTTRGVRSLNLENMQRRWGAAVDGTRTYNEQTVHWLALYLGWPTVVLAVLGYAVLIALLVLRRTYALAAVVTMGLTMSALYLWTSQVAPDQPWAMRRYVPVVMPLLLIAAAAALQAVWQWRGARQVGRVLVVLAAAYLLTFPARVTWPMRHVREEVPQRQQVEALCAAIGSRGAVVEVDEATIFGYGQALRSFCDVPTIGLVGATPDQLADMKRAVAAHGRELFVLNQDERPLPVQYANRGTPPAFSIVTVQRWPTQINVAPDEPDSQRYTMFLSRVDDAGLALAVAPNR